MSRNSRTDLSPETSKPVVTRADIVAGLRRLGIAPGDVVLVHSSLSAFGYVEGGADTVIDALLEAIGPEGTLAAPTFTWGAFHAATGVVFDVRRTPCETGKIPETFRRRPGVLRGIHICHSMAAFGPRAEEVLGDGVKSFAEGSAFDNLYRLNSWNLLLGVTFSSCTALHSAEEWVQVPYRKYRDFRNSTVILPDGRTIPSPSVEYLRRDGSGNDFAKMEDVMAEAGLLRTCRIGNARCLNARLRDIVDTAVRLLEENPYFLSRPPAS
jgi:aminoglycoside 3-N-acetyltransferase